MNHASTAALHPAAVAFLQAVDRAAWDLPPMRRSELLGTLTEDLRAVSAGASPDADVQAALVRLGRPEDIAAEARHLFADEMPPHMVAPMPPMPPMQFPQAQASGPGGLAITGLVLIGVGLIPMIGHLAVLIGILCVLVSRAWAGRVKVVAAILALGALTSQLLLFQVFAFFAEPGRSVDGEAAVWGLFASIGFGLVLSYGFVIALFIYLAVKLARPSKS